MNDFDMPKTGTWEVRSGWVVNHLAADLKLTIAPAAGFVGNLGFESDGFTILQEISPLVSGSKGGYGWSQWTGPRREAFEIWCRGFGLDQASDEANYRYIVAELKGPYAWFLTRLQHCASIEAACRLTHQLYEASEDVADGSYRSQPARLLWAKRAYNGAVAQQAAQPAPLPTVESVQRRLNALGCLLDVDGDAGPKTCTAILEHLA